MATLAKKVDFAQVDLQRKKPMADEVTEHTFQSFFLLLYLLVPAGRILYLLFLEELDTDPPRDTQGLG